MTALRVAGATDERDDVALVDAARAGDDRAFESLYERYRGRIANYVFSMVGDWGRAEDVTQEIFISALGRMRASERDIAFRPWIYTIARNACIDQHRRTRRTEEVPLGGDGGEGGEPLAMGRLPGGPLEPQQAAEAGQQLDLLLGAFGALAPSHHEILVLRELEGRSYREIGEQMGLSGPSVENTLFRARRRLSEEYDELATGRRCARVEALLEAGAPGIREQRRLGIHLAFCRSCRHRAQLAGVEPGIFSRTARRVAAILPLPAFLRPRRLFGSGDGGGGAGPMAHLAASGPALEASGPAWVKGAAAAAALALATTGAGIATRAGSTPHPLDRPGRAPAAVVAGPGAHAPADDRASRRARNGGRTATPLRHQRANGGHSQAGARSRRPGGAATHTLRRAPAGRAGSGPAPGTGTGSASGGQQTAPTGAPSTPAPAPTASSSSGSSGSGGSSSSPAAKTVTSTARTVHAVTAPVAPTVHTVTGQATTTVQGAVGGVQGTVGGVQGTVGGVQGTVGGVAGAVQPTAGGLLGG